MTSCLIALDRGAKSTRRKAAPVHKTEETEERKDFFKHENGIAFAGTHLILDVYNGKRLDDLDLIEKALLECVRQAGATLLHIHLHHFTPFGGVSGVVVLAESHISIHSWPEKNYAALDVFMCGNAKPHKCIGVLQKAFGPDCHIAIAEMKRGAVPEDTKQ